MVQEFFCLFNGMIQVVFEALVMYSFIIPANVGVNRYYLFLDRMYTATKYWSKCVFAEFQKSQRVLFIKSPIICRIIINIFDVRA